MIPARAPRVASSPLAANVRIADFTLERYFARWEFAVQYVLCASDVQPLSLPELLALADDDARARCEHLSLGYT